MARQSDSSDRSPFRRLYRVKRASTSGPELRAFRLSCLTLLGSCTILIHPVPPDSARFRLGQRPSLAPATSHRWICSVGFWLSFPGIRFFSRTSAVSSEADARGCYSRLGDTFFSSRRHLHLTRDLSLPTKMFTQPGPIPSRYPISVARPTGLQTFTLASISGPT